MTPGYLACARPAPLVDVTLRSVLARTIGGLSLSDDHSMKVEVAKARHAMPVDRSGED